MKGITFISTVCDATFDAEYDPIERCIWLRVSVIGVSDVLWWCSDMQAAKRRLGNPAQGETIGDGNHANTIHHHNAGSFNMLLISYRAQRIELVRIVGICFSLSRILSLCTAATIPYLLEPTRTFAFELAALRIEIDFLQDSLTLTQRTIDAGERKLLISGFDRKADADDWVQACRYFQVFQPQRAQHLPDTFFFLTETLDKTILTAHDLPRSCGHVPFAFSRTQFTWFYACLMFFLWDANKFLPELDKYHQYFPTD